MALLIRCLVCFSIVSALISEGCGYILPPSEADNGMSLAPVRRECSGTYNGLSYTGSREYHYQRMKSRYTGCTHVTGNLEITMLDSTSIDYDLSFLRDIRYVSGYVLICIVTQSLQIPLHSLEIIRGNHTFSYANYSGYGLTVGLTYLKGGREAVGLKELQLPSLKEISNGKVAFQNNPSLGFIDTINWDVIVRHTPDAVEYRLNAFNTSVSGTVDRSGCPSGRMWGVGFCQADVPDIQCHSSCNGRCFGSGSGECCHDTCAVGCHGPTNRDCIRCKDYEYNSECVSFCPATTKPNANICMPN